MTGIRICKGSKVAIDTLIATLNNRELGWKLRSTEQLLFVLEDCEMQLAQLLPKISDRFNARVKYVINEKISAATRRNSYSMNVKYIEMERRKGGWYLTHLLKYNTIAYDIGEYTEIILNPTQVFLAECEFYSKFNIDSGQSSPRT